MNQFVVAFDDLGEQALRTLVTMGPNGRAATIDRLSVTALCSAMPAVGQLVHLG